MQGSCRRRTCDSVAVGVVQAAPVHRVLVHHQTHMVVSTPEGGEPRRIPHPALFDPAGHTQMQSELSGAEKKAE